MRPTQSDPKPVAKRARTITAFDEAKRAQAKLEAIELKRQAVMDGLSEEARTLIESLEELRASRPIAEVLSPQEAQCDQV